MDKIVKKRNIKNKRGNSRSDFAIRNNILLKSKRSQLTIFIIIALVIVAILLILFYPRIKVLVTGTAPTDYIEQCVKEATEEALGKISVQGGSLEPENYILYQNNKVEYACYTNEYYKRCTMQKPFLKQDIEKEINDYVKPRAENCIENLKQQLEKQGSEVALQDVRVETSIIPNAIIVTVNAPMTIVKSSTSTFNKFKVNIKSEMYELIMLSSSIANYEARYGNSDSLTYMLYYPDIKVEKKVQDEGSKIYILTYKPSGEKFIFASRSIAWPPGYVGEREK